MKNFAKIFTVGSNDQDILLRIDLNDNQVPELRVTCWFEEMGFMTINLGVKDQNDIDAAYAQAELLLEKFNQKRVECIYQTMLDTLDELGYHF